MTRRLILEVMSQLLMKLWKEGSFRHSSSGQMSPKDWKWPDLICICPDESIGTHKVGIGPIFWKLRPLQYHSNIDLQYQKIFITILEYSNICRNSTKGKKARREGESSMQRGSGYILSHPVLLQKTLP